MKEENSYTVGELAEAVELSPRTIRYYEEIGLLDHPRRKANRRLYTNEDLRRLKFIKRLKLLGLSLAEMAELKNIYRIHQSNEKVLVRLLELLDNHAGRLSENIAALSQLQREIEAYRDRIGYKLKQGNSQ
ncbi:MAG: MerR family transcriptional regulator [Myxococcales bacterium]|nr:MAG: MerR family transcriptional regulator [Myxococcales bacterium]